MHAEVLRAKDETIALLREQIAHSRETPVQVSVPLPPDFAVVQPAIVPDGKARPKRERQPKPDPVDFSTIDPNDAIQMAALAKRYLGREPYNAWELKQIVRNLRRQISAAKANKARSEREAVNQAETERENTLPIEEPEDQRPEVAYVPLHIANLIETAAKGGVQ